MKKALLITAIAAVSISAAACSSKKAAETTAAPAETTTTAAETSSEAEAEEDYTSGVITAIDGDILTVKDDYDDQERKYDISKAEVTKDFPLSEGDWVDLTVPANTTEDPFRLSQWKLLLPCWSRTWIRLLTAPSRMLLPIP